ncbi:hypothetical protein L1887_61800 [Cichorium endivia]|nr:hypothetical protein L1887_61800 [Cichorium endivia]
MLGLPHACDHTARYQVVSHEHLGGFLNGKDSVQTAKHRRVERINAKKRNTAMTQAHNGAVKMRLRQKKIYRMPSEARPELHLDRSGTRTRVRALAPKLAIVQPIARPHL